MAAEDTPREAGRQARALRLLAFAGTWGALLTVVVLAASVYLRLTTNFDAAGEAITSLPESAEAAARIAHRIAAMAVSILALLAVFATATLRPAHAGRLAAVGAILALTVVLSVLGRYTTGYRIAGVTIGNVAGGVALAASFWWLREQAVRPGHARGGILEWSALSLFLAQAGFGAAASAAAMRADFSVTITHFALGLATVVVTAACAWVHRSRSTRTLALAIAAASAVQFAIGAGLAMLQPDRPLLLGWLHAVLATALAIALASLAARSGQG